MISIPLLVNSIGLLLILFIAWWFWIAKKTTSAEVMHGRIDIAVDGGIYIPATIKAKINTPLTLRFTRYDASPCAEMVVFPELGISHELPIKQPFDITIVPEKMGTFEFTCAMGMYRGKLIVE